MKKCALITGGSRGIGRAIALAMAKDHAYHILINYAANETAANETIQAIQALGGTAEPLPFRVENLGEVQKTLENWQQHNPEAIIEVIVNNAGVTKDGLLMLMEENDWDSVVNTSLKGMYNVTRSLIQPLLRNRYGRIVNVVSLSGLKGVPGQMNYSAAKGGMIAATKALAQEVAKRKITVNAVAPGFIVTDMTSELPIEELKKQIPMQRFGEAEEVADLVSFLISPKAAYITGEVININGGIYS